MTAGTVISGGFPGRVAQEVQPNPKCRGCMHYVDSAGRTGACSIGSRPWLCGDGEAQDIGYAPITAGAGAYLPDMNANISRAREAETHGAAALYGADSTRPVQMQQISLGEEHVHLIKSMVERHVGMEQMMCRLCKSRGAIGRGPMNVEPQECTCKPIEARAIAKSLMAQLSNRERSRITFDDAVEFVYEVAEAGFTMPLRKSHGDVAPTNTHLSSAHHTIKTGKLSFHLAPGGSHSSDEMPHGSYEVHSKPGTIGGRLGRKHVLKYYSQSGKPHEQKLSTHSTLHDAHQAAEAHHAKMSVSKALSWKPSALRGGKGSVAERHLGSYHVAPAGPHAEGFSAHYQPKVGDAQHLGEHPNKKAAQAAAEKHFTSKSIEKAGESPSQMARQTDTRRPQDPYAESAPKKPTHHEMEPMKVSSPKPASVAPKAAKEIEMPAENMRPKMSEARRAPAQGTSDFQPSLPKKQERDVGRVSYRAKSIDDAADAITKAVAEIEHDDVEKSFGMMMKATGGQLSAAEIATHQAIGGSRPAHQFSHHKDAPKMHAQAAAMHREAARLHKEEGGPQSRALASLHEAHAEIHDVAAKRGDIGKSNDVEKAVDDTKHSHIVTGPLQEKPRGFKTLRAAHNHADKLDNKYGGYRHPVARNPNFKPSGPTEGPHQVAATSSPASSKQVHGRVFRSPSSGQE